MKDKRVQRKISRVKYILVALNTLIIFIVGIFFGQQLERARVDMLYNELSTQNLDYQNLITEYEYISYLINTKNLDNVTCSMIETTYYTSISHLDNARIKLENYLNSAEVNQNDYSILRDRYSNVQINYWILGDQIKKACNSDFVTVLYFFGDKKVCPECDDQGIYLSYIKQKYGNKVMVFALDSAQKGPIRLLVNRYGITNSTLPAVVITDRVYGFLTSDKVQSIICKNDNICLSNQNESTTAR